ncbi:MAG TPA: phosphate ABC transporter ATP-binding protein [Anaerolinea thermolimosa]|uniref:Phosphate ABC transporter ATP-binding protein n=1 Tax=Anaerolinea thermolimosa TaxID=229919 RepID=A0A3D1JF09_9CHLR|nr:phosphate ABC transporter ATP-binding protein [Anaerolinea thermolimosa]GAP05602.1 phosphate ABC transporter ATP-binding protein, PhoT family [Anaerolinea thermolimosa]HCE16827.1 phosphate ABC transporter ATP-binding protein [Anaerolinea thermolimosa]
MDKIVIENFSIRYSDGVESLRNISLSIPANAVTVLFGPAGGGKSTLLRAINRLNDLADVKETSGRILFNGQNILDPKVDVVELRRKIGMVFSRPVVLPMSIYQNVSYPLELMGEKRKSRLDEAVEKALKRAVLWDEVYDRLHDPATAISGGQQQRLCLARVFALEPEVIMLDEPTSALDPVSTARIEGLMHEIKEEFTIVWVPHNVQQAARMADYAAFFLQGELIEYAEGKKLFVNPKDQRTSDYVTGRFG